jgi:D-glycero-D-manno-heptose 1,7-bisphosphate phosphatase
MMRAAVFLDRDGVLNVAHEENGVPRPPADATDVRLLPGAREGCKRLRAAGYLLVVATNQPDVARGTQSRTRVEQINETLRAQLPLDDIVVCYHDDADGCTCRKPKPGLLLEAATRWRIDLGRSFMVGDRWRDIEAGAAAGCRTVLVAGSREGVDCTPDYTAESLGTAAEWILTQSREPVEAL